MALVLFPDLDSNLRIAHVHRFTTLWRLERTDGVILRFTDHDTIVNFDYLHAQEKAKWLDSNGYHPPTVSAAPTSEVYTPVDSVAVSARQKQAGIKEHNIELTAVISSAALTEDDLRAGKYREAKVVEMVVDWKFPYAGYLNRNIYYLTSVTYTREFWKAQISGVPTWMRLEAGYAFTPSCRWVLGDTNCRVDLAPFTAAGAVVSTADGRRVFVASGTVLTPDWYTDGYLIWTSGPNAGIRCEIQSSAGSNFAFFLNTPFVISPGDTFTAVAGCDRLSGTCKTKFTNFLRYGGFLQIPGNDALIRGPL